MTQRLHPGYISKIKSPHSHTVEYYSAIKKNKILPFAATWMDLEGNILSEVSQRKKNTV